MGLNSIWIACGVLAPTHSSPTHPREEISAFLLFCYLIFSDHICFCLSLLLSYIIWSYHIHYRILSYIILYLASDYLVFSQYIVFPRMLQYLIVYYIIIHNIELSYLRVAYLIVSCPILYCIIGFLYHTILCYLTPYDLVLYDTISMYPMLSCSVTFYNMLAYMAILT